MLTEEFPWLLLHLTFYFLLYFLYTFCANALRHLLDTMKQHINKKKKIKKINSVKNHPLTHLVKCLTRIPECTSSKSENAHSALLSCKM